jgi:hypothetical protein
MVMRRVADRGLARMFSMFGADGFAHVGGKGSTDDHKRECERQHASRQHGQYIEPAFRSLI